MVAHVICHASCWCCLVQFGRDAAPSSVTHWGAVHKNEIFLNQLKAIKIAMLCKMPLMPLIPIGIMWSAQHTWWFSLTPIISICSVPCHSLAIWTNSFDTGASGPALPSTSLSGGHYTAPFPLRRYWNIHYYASLLWHQICTVTSKLIVVNC